MAENSDIIKQICEGDVDAETVVILWNMKRDVLNSSGGPRLTKFDRKAEPRAGGNSGKRTTLEDRKFSFDEDPANKLRASYKKMNAQGIEPRPQSPPHAGGDSSVGIPPEQQVSIDRWKAKDGPPSLECPNCEIATFVEP
jgi:hypothetical protein